MSINCWLPVDKAMPVDVLLDSEVLIATDGGFVATGYYNAEARAWYYWDGSGSIAGVTHWMPMPEPPK